MKQSKYDKEVSNIRTILIEFSDVLGYNDSKEHREAFHKAFAELSKLFINKDDKEV